MKENAKEEKEEEGSGGSKWKEEEEEEEVGGEELKGLDEEEEQDKEDVDDFGARMDRTFSFTRWRRGELAAVSIR